MSTTASNTSHYTSNNASSNADPTLTIADIARRLNMSETFVYRQATTGKLNCYHIGGTVRKRGAIRFSESQFQEYLSTQLDKQPALLLSIPSQPATRDSNSQHTISGKLNKLLRNT